MSLDLNALRADFPALHQDVNGQPLVYLDNAATTHKPQAVIDAVTSFYSRDNANVHRGLHTLSGRATRRYEGARDAIAAYIGAPRREQIVFTRGTTESINIVAQCYARPRLTPDHNIVVTGLEHHSNIVPWQLACQASGAELRVVPVGEDGALQLDGIDTLIDANTLIVAFNEASNAIGTRNDVATLSAAARRHGSAVLIDAAQAMGHHRIDVNELDADFVAFSGHKMFGPTGIGVLYGRTEALEALEPWQGGGDMIETVSFSGSTWNELPYRLEAGTPNIAGAIGLGAAVEYLQTLDWAAVQAHEQQLLELASAALREVPGLRIIGDTTAKAPIVSFVMDQAHPQDIGTLLDEMGIAVRTGHHCAMPLMERFAIPGTARASIALYNTAEEIQRLADGLMRVARLFGQSAELG